MGHPARTTAQGVGQRLTCIAPANLPFRHKAALFAVMAFGQFMALLDIQIVAASLSQIQAGLSAGADEIAWVQTAYLMAEVVMIPLSGFLSQALSTRWLFALSAGLFTLSSLACGLATDLKTMIICRAIQGFVGGAMVSTVFATGFAMFAGPQQRMIPAVLGLVSTLARLSGPRLAAMYRSGILALAVLHQHHPRHSDHHRRDYVGQGGPRAAADAGKNRLASPVLAGP